MQQLSKVVFVGPVGAGKTTAVQMLSDIPVVSTDEHASDVTLNSKGLTTVAMDYGKVTLANGRAVHLYGAPGQERFSFMWEILARGGNTALILLLNNSWPHPLRDMEFYISNFRSFADAGRMLVAVTHTDLTATPTLLEYESELRRMGLDLPLFNVDVRNREGITVLIPILHMWNE